MLACSDLHCLYFCSIFYYFSISFSGSNLFSRVLCVSSLRFLFVGICYLLLSGFALQFCRYPFCSFADFVPNFILQKSLLELCSICYHLSYHYSGGLHRSIIWKHFDTFLKHFDISSKFQGLDGLIVRIKLYMKM